RTGAGLEKGETGPAPELERRCGATEDEVREAISDRDASHPSPDVPSDSRVPSISRRCIGSRRTDRRAREGAPPMKEEGGRTKSRRTLAAALALARPLVPPTGIATAAAAGKPAPTGKVNINTATAQQLTVLPGVGEKLAARIVEYRQKSGGFKSVSELMNVQGIGEKNLAKIQSYLTVSG